MSFNIGLSGLNAASEEINITGNNIANASTVGFKKSRTEFGDVFAASVGGGAAQQGSGVSLQNIAQDFSQGNISFTGNSLDLAINGKGFFVLSGDSGLAYTRAGAFGTDKDGNIINSSGERLQGFAPTANGDASGGGPLTDLVVTTGEIPPNATTEVESVINLDASASPSSIVGTNLASNSGTSGVPRLGVQSARAAELRGVLSTAGTDFSGTTAASATGAFNISAGLNFASAGGNQGFSISVNGGAFQAIDLSGADTADEATLIAHVQTELDAALSPPNNVIVTAENNRLVLTTAATGSSANITIGNLVEGLAQNIVTAGTSVSGRTAPPTGFRLTLDGDSRDIVIDQDYTNSGTAAIALGGGAGAGNEALEDSIQAQIDGSPALAGRVNVSINPDGTIRFVANDQGAQNLQIDPVITTVGSVNFDQIVNFETERRQGSLDVSNLDFSGGNSTSFTVTVDGDSATTSFGGQTPGTLANSLAAVQDAIDTTALNGVVTASLDANDQIVFSTVSTGDGATLDVIADGTGAVFTGNAALNPAGFDFATTNASFDISVDSETPISISVSTLTSDPDSTLLEVQNALDAAGIGNRVTASLDGSDQIVFTRSSDTGASTSIAITNSNATAIAELGITDLSEFGTDGFELAPAAYTGRDAITVSIDYAYDSSSGLGRLVFSSDNQADVIEFDDVSTNAANQLGIFIGDGTVTTATNGTDVVGQINGIDASGSGQLLRAATGNVPAKPGFYLNTTVGNLSASTTADTFKVTVDGITSSAITLGTIFNPDPDVVAASLEAAINNNPLLLAAGVGVNVDYDTITGGFGIISNTTGVTSSVSLSEITGSAGTIFGFTPGVGANGRTGTAAEGQPDPSAGLRVQVNGGALGGRGSVSFVRGIADQLDQLIDSFLDPNGLLSNRTSALNLELENIADERVDLTERLQSSEERLRSSFLANDLIISNLNTTADFLSSQLSLLEGLLGSSNGNDD